MSVSNERLMACALRSRRYRSFSNRSDQIRQKVRGVKLFMERAVRQRETQAYRERQKERERQKKERKRNSQRETEIERQTEKEMRDTVKEIERQREIEVT